MRNLILPLLAASLMLGGCFGKSAPPAPEKPPVDKDSRKPNPLEAETLLSQSIFVHPLSAGERSLYIRFTSTADKAIDHEGMQEELKNRMRAKGFRITSPDQANFLLQVNVLSISKTTKSLAKEAVENGFGAAVAIAAAAGPAGSVAGAITQSTTSILFRDTYLNMVTDILLSERQQRLNLLKADNTTTEHSDWKKHTSRAISSAKDVNGNAEELIDILEDNLLRVLSGLL